MVIKKTILVLITILMVSTALADIYSKEEKTTNFIVTPSVSYRYDVFKWSIPDVHYPEKKCSELIWKNYIVQPSIKIELEPQPNQFTFLGQGKYGYILKNRSKSWDYDWYVHKKKSGKVISTPDSNALSLVKGNILDLSGTVGYSFNLLKNNLVTFYVGYDYSDYRNNQYGGRQLVDNKNDVVIPFDKLLSRYNFKIKSPWIGLSVNIPINDKFLVNPTIKYYTFKYLGKGYWLLRDDLKKNPSLKHNSKGNGLGFDIDFLYKYTDNLDFKINIETKRFKIKKGEYQMFYNKNSAKSEIISKNKLFDLSLRSFSITTGVRCKF